MKKLFLFLIVSFTSIANAQTWTTLTTGSNSNLKAIHFPSATTGYAVGDNGAILKTINGGNSWTSTTANYPGYWFWDVHFLNVDSGFVVGESDPGGNPSGNAIILKTTNGGTTWAVVYSNSTHPLRDLFVVNKDTIYACGGAEAIFGATSKIIKSIDGGATWTQVGPTYQDAMLGGMFFLNGNYGFVGMYESVSGLNFPTSTTWLSTTNGGGSFNMNNVASSISYWNFASDFPDANVGYMSRSTYVGGDSVYIRKTTNGGNSWTEAAMPSYVGSIYGMDFINSDTGYVVGGDGAIMKTMNGGNSWVMQPTNNFNNLHSIFFLNYNYGFAAGDLGTILRFGTIPTGINNNVSNDTDWNIYPSAFNTTASISFSEVQKNTTIYIINDHGEVVMKYTINGKKLLIERGNLASGIYVIMVKGKQGFSERKILIM